MDVERVQLIVVQLRVWSLGTHLDQWLGNLSGEKEHVQKNRTVHMSMRLELCTVAVRITLRFTHCINFYWRRRAYARGIVGKY